MDVIETRPLPIPDGTLPSVSQETGAPVAHGGPPADDAHLNQTVTPTSGAPFDPGAPSTGPPLDPSNLSPEAATTYWYELVDQYIAAAFLGIKPRTLADWRYREVGPNWVDISPTCKRYRRIDLAVYVEARTQTVVEDGENQPADAEGGIA